MNLLLLGKRGSQLAELAKALQPLSPTSVRLAESWEAVEGGVEQSRPDLVLICMSRLLTEGISTVSRAQIYLIEQGVATIVAIHPETTAERLVAEEYFSKEAIVESPYQTEVLKERIQRAIEKGSKKAEGDSREFDEEWTEAAFLAEQRTQPDSVVEVSPRLTFMGRLATRQAREKQGLTPEREATRSPMGAAPAEQGSPQKSASPSAIPPSQSRTGQIPAVSGHHVSKAGVATRPTEDRPSREGKEGSGAPAIKTESDESMRGEAHESAPEPDLRPTSPRSAPHADPIRDLYHALTMAGEGLEPVRLTPGFPLLSKGQIDQASPLRVLYGLAQAGATGRWVLTRGNQQKEFAYLDGQIGLLDVSGVNASKRMDLGASLLWSSGVYSFVVESIARDRFTALGNVLEFMHEMVHQGLTFQDVTDALSPFFSMIPTITSRVLDDSRILSQLSGVTQLLGKCTGAPLEEIVVEEQRLSQRLMKNALFCYLIDAISFWDSILQRPVTLKYDQMGLRRSTRKSLALASEEEEISPEEEALLVELAARATEFQSWSAYQIFGLEPGCGREAVEEVYYRLVKEHHPDVYALARSPSAKPLAEMVFRRIRDGFRELLSQEKSQPDGAGIRKKTARAIPMGSNGERVTVSEETTSRPAGTKEVPTGMHPAAHQSASWRKVSSVTAVPPLKPTGTPTEGPTRSELAPTVPDAAVANGRGPQPSRAQAAVTGSSPSVPATPMQGPQPSRAQAAVTGSSPSVPVTTVGAGQPSRSHLAVTGSGSRHQTAASFSHRAVGSSGAVPAIRATVKDAQQIQISPRQAFKNGLSLLGSGAIQRAAESFALAYAGDQSNGTYLAHSVWSSYLVDKITSKEAIATLKAGLEELEEKEHLALFLGQILAAEGQQSKATNYFNRCLEINPNNIEAARQIRLHQMRHGKKGEGLLDKLLSLRGSKAKDKKR
ncbi:MAG: hypothetical protein JW797_05285 [Bradymonadales bacterium]|nr:hypothetical protein [Bradymonadales bacterium]